MACPFATWTKLIFLRKISDPILSQKNVGEYFSRHQPNTGVAGSTPHHFSGKGQGTPPVRTFPSGPLEEETPPASRFHGGPTNPTNLNTTEGLGVRDVKGALEIAKQAKQQWDGNPLTWKRFSAGMGVLLVHAGSMFGA